MPVNADVPDIDILLIDEQDPYVNPLGIKGLGRSTTRPESGFEIYRFVWRS